MILSRFVENLKQQHWTSVFIELVIVVLGVFIGLQVNNWNEARANRGIAARHLGEIAEDLQSYLDLYGSLHGSALARIAAVDYIYDKAFDRKLPAVVHLGSGNFVVPKSSPFPLSTGNFTVPKTAPFPPDRLDNLMGAIDLVRVTVGSRNGYESLISSGHLGLIQNKDLARTIQVYYGRYDDLLDTGKVFRTFRNDGAALLYKYGVSVADERPPQEIVAIARDHPDFAAYLRSQREWAVLNAYLLERQRTETVDLLAKIRNEVKDLQ